MKHQQTQLACKHNFIRLMALAVMLVLMVCCMALWVSAADGEITIDLNNAGFVFNEEKGYWEKTYDGETIIVSEKEEASEGEGSTESEEEPTITVNGEKASSATLDTADVVPGGFNILTINYGDNKTVDIPVKINPVVLNWKSEYKVEETYNPNVEKYTGFVPINESMLDDTKVVIGADDKKEAVAINGNGLTIEEGNYQFPYEVSLIGCGSTTIYINVALDSSNYVVAPLPVDITVAPAEIERVGWESLSETLTYGDANLLEIGAIGIIADINPIPMNVLVKVGEDWLTLEEAFGEGGLAVGTYELCAVPASPYYAVGDSTIDATNTITITKAVYNVVLKDNEFVDNGGLSNPNASIGYG
ncbi:MAG: hypothetical protein IJB94_02255, partial [Clostridia bacterium]|nr:hypothetical protein [Clostridia bacterium]